jgi:hypothetical protein
MIITYSQFILNETLKTNNIDITIRDSSRELSLLRYKFEISKNSNNTISLKLFDFNLTQGSIELYLSNIDNIFIDRHGWFPSTMKLKNISGMDHLLAFDRDYLVKNYKYLQEVEISFESKFDLEANVPNKLYHLSIQEYLKNVLTIGLIPKSKSKLSKHLDRIYLCSNPSDCKSLISQMKLHYSNKPMKSNINDKWIIYEINTGGLNISLYRDPNYTGGFYTINNIPKSNITVFDKE